MAKEPISGLERKWYKKKRYIIPLALFSFISIVNSFNSSSSDTVNKNYAPVLGQVEKVVPISAPAQSQVKTKIQVQQPEIVTQPLQKNAVPVTTEEVPLSNDNIYINSQGKEVHSPAYASSIPQGASAVCGDGTYSFSQSRRGTCSHHGGVSEWLN